MLLRLRDKHRLSTAPQALANIAIQAIEEGDPFDRRKEHFFAIGINDTNVSFAELVSLGIDDMCLVDPAIAFQRAASECTASVAFIHNHPDGDVRASDEDVIMTYQLIEFGEHIGITVLDHIVIGNSSEHKFYSIRKNHPAPWHWLGY